MLETDLDDSRVSRAEALARRLEARILDGGMRAGDRVGTKEDLRERFGVAVATVNEAIRLLQARGLVQVRPGPRGGVFASEPSPFVRANWDLHRRIADITPNRILRNLYVSLLDATESELGAVIPDSEFAGTVDGLLTLHREVVAAIVAVIQREFGISQPAVSQHLRVLRDSGFATVRAEGTRRLYAVDSGPLQEVDLWLDALATELARGKRQRGGTNDPGSPTRSAPTTTEKKEEQRP